MTGPVARPRSRPTETPNVDCQDYRAHQGQHRQTAAGWICLACPTPSPGSPVMEQRSAVTIWRSGKGRRWSVRVVEGATADELEQLIRLAEDAAQRIEGGRP